MAKSAAGKWVSRVGSSGGGKAYKKTRPSNYYGALVLIVVLGLIAAVYSRYEYQHPGVAAAGTPPAIGTTWYAALSIEACGKTLPFLNTDPAYKGGFVVQPANVIKISPVSAADSGNNATLSQFAAEYPGLIASSTQLAIPNANGVANAATTYKNGQTCPSTSKYPGQAGQISYAYWTTFGQKKPVITTNPSSIKFAQYLRVTMAFDPQGVTPKAPQQSTVNAMFAAVQSPTTTVGVTTPTTKPATTSSVKGSTTSVPSTATTVPSSATTTKTTTKNSTTTTSAG
ncbi:MAG: hypothetical protein HKL86_06955 [Acidimicrobiaceae bacterium]|nr:hypothetical protein [Acidimicrobiaceae bacterium]